MARLEDGSVIERQAADGPDDLGPRLADLSGRLELLVRYLTGPALAARVDPADLVQDVLLRLLRSDATRRAAEEGEAALWAFARTMARRTVVDAARRARRAPRRFSSLTPELESEQDPAGPAAGPGPATHVANAESLEAWVRAFQALPAEHRRVLGLRRFEGLSARETAQRMGRTETAIHSLFRRALGAWEAQIPGDGSRSR